MGERNDSGDGSRPLQTPPTARTYGWLVLGSLAFILYGSLVPFEFRARPFDKAIEAFHGAMSGRLRIESRADALANILLGVPLGFGLLAYTCVDRHSRSRELLLAAIMLPGCVAFAAFVEFAQLFCPTRTCAASDVVMQGIGAAVGMTAWMIAGQWFTSQAREAWAGPRIGGSAGRILVAYITLLAFVQALPLDLTLSPKDIYKSFRDKVWYIPFDEFRGASVRQSWDLVHSRIEIIGLYLPIGLLAGCLPGRFWRTRSNAFTLLALALLLGIGMEGIQLLVMSRSPSATDVVVGAFSVLVGWALCRGMLGKWPEAVWFAVWFAIVLVGSWEPFDFSGELARVDWLPFQPLEEGSPLFVLQNMLTKVILFSPFGVIAAVATRHQSARMRLGVAAAFGGLAALTAEMGQLFLPSHTPSVTDVILGATGAWFGAAATARAMGIPKVPSAIHEVLTARELLGQRVLR